MIYKSKSSKENKANDKLNTHVKNQQILHENKQNKDKKQSGIPLKNLKENEFLITQEG